MGNQTNQIEGIDQSILYALGRLEHDIASLKNSVSQQKYDDAVSVVVSLVRNTGEVVSYFVIAAKRSGWSDDSGLVKYLNKFKIVNNKSLLHSAQHGPNVV
jgi:hypothetical protein